MKLIQSIISIVAIMGVSVVAQAAPKIKCTDYFHSYYVFNLETTACSKSSCTLLAEQHNSPNGCHPSEQSFTVSVKRKGKLLRYSSPVLNVTINTAKKPSTRLLAEYGRPFGGKRALYRGQARFTAPITYPTPEPNGINCTSEFKDKYAQLVCIVIDEGK
jgi:hypothetical protein